MGKLEKTSDSKIQCSKCANRFPRSHFNKTKQSKTGIISRCKNCTRDYARDYYTLNRQRIKKRQEIYYKENKDRIILKQLSNRDPTRHRDYMRGYILKKYHEIMIEAKEYLGGECVKCGSADGLEIDHIDRTTKTGEINKMVGNRAKFWAEIDRCQLLCKDCHIRKTVSERGQLYYKGMHGFLSSYRYCKCRKCKDAMLVYYRKLRNVKYPQRTIGNAL